MTAGTDPLLALLPAFERRRGPDGQPTLVEALVTAIGTEVTLADVDLDQLYDDLFIETCADWAAPYLGAL
ncbi:hypothetical protein D7Y13_44295, partial [Corallococcus praedator]